MSAHSPQSAAALTVVVDGKAHVVEASPDTPQSYLKRRLGVALARGGDVDEARARATAAATAVKPRALK